MSAASLPLPPPPANPKDYYEAIYDAEDFEEAYQRLRTRFAHPIGGDAESEKGVAELPAAYRNGAGWEWSPGIEQWLRDARERISHSTLEGNHECDALALLARMLRAVLQPICLVVVEMVKVEASEVDVVFEKVREVLGESLFGWSKKECDKRLQAEAAQAGVAGNGEGSSKSSKLDPLDVHSLLRFFAGSVDAAAIAGLDKA